MTDKPEKSEEDKHLEMLIESAHTTIRTSVRGTCAKLFD